MIFILILFFSISLHAQQDYIIDEDGEYTESTDAFQAREVTIDTENHPGKNLYLENCDICHDGTVTKAPAKNWLELMLPSNILRAMNEGIMQFQSSHLSAEERILIAEYLYKQKSSYFPEEAKVNMCSDSKQSFNLKG